MPVNIRKSVTAAAMAALLISLSACAQDGNRSQQLAAKAQERFAAADVNHDGFLSRDEAQTGMPRLADHFDEIDTDRDGQLSTAEILAYIKQRRGSR